MTEAHVMLENDENTQAASGSGFSTVTHDANWSGSGTDLNQLNESGGAHKY